MCIFRNVNAKDVAAPIIKLLGGATLRLLA
jgi:hypothetical protein